MKRASLPSTEEEPQRQIKGPGRKRGSKTAMFFDGILREEERLRQRIFSETLARMAGCRPEVTAIRKRLLRGRLLSERTARTLSSKVALRHFNVEWFTQKGIPLFSHQSHYIEPRSMTKLLPFRGDDRMVLKCRGRQIRAYPRRSRATLSKTDPRVHLPGATLHVRAESVLGEIAAAAGHLAKLYDWAEADAAVFVLTGATPRIPTIGIEDPWSLGGIHADHANFWIRLRIEPWVSAQSVKKAYQLAQQRLCERQARPLQKESLQLFDFVESYLERKLKISWLTIRRWEEERKKRHPIPWSRMADAWNRRQGNEQFTGSSMSRAYRRVRDELLYRPFTPLGMKSHRRKGRRSA